MNSANILVIDDEVQIRKLLSVTLNAAGYQVFEAATGTTGIQMAANHPPDLIILDLGLPDEDGQAVLTKLREWYLSPVIILSVRNTENDIVRALDNGANDYLTKPFFTGELVARVRNALRYSSEKAKEPIIRVSDVCIDLAGRTVKKEGVIVHTTVTEFDLLALLAVNENRVLTHQFILKEIWGPGCQERSQYLRVYIAQLRKKIEINPNKPLILVTVAGIGYRFLRET